MVDFGTLKFSNARRRHAIDRRARMKLDVDEQIGLRSVSSLGRVRRRENWAALLFVASRFLSGEAIEMQM
jgi:hypothetical protein